MQQVALPTDWQNEFKNNIEKSKKTKGQDDLLTASWSIGNMRKNQSVYIAGDEKPPAKKSTMNYPKGMFKYLQTIDTFANEEISDSEKIRLYKTYIIPTTLKPQPK